MARDNENLSIPSVRAALDLLTVDKLKKLLSLLPGDLKATRKADLVEVIERHLHGEKLKELWEKLDETQRLAVAETMYSAEGVFDAARFQAKYGTLPVFGTRKEGWSYGETPSLLRLFIYREGRYGSGEGGAVPGDLKQRLQKFVPKPAAASLAALDEPPDCYERIDKDYEWQEGDEGITLVSPRGVYRMPRQKPKVKTTTRQIPLTRRDTERDALAEAAIVLRLIDQGKLGVSDKTFLPGAAALRELGGLLSNGEFYPPAAKGPMGVDEIGPIKAYAWLLLMQAAKLAELHGKKLALTKAGRDALGKPAAETLRLVWQRWLKTKLFDEFNRVDAIKGQQGKGKRGLTAAESRRAAIVQALRQCPVGGWVRFDDFSRHMQAAGYDFEITRDPWGLYISDANYGSLGHSGYHDWPILQKRYLACLLFEYAATLGLIDVAYVEPWEAERDYRDLWGTDDLDFLSRYDGLLYFRLNPLGAYGLGLADDYRPSVPESKATLSVLPGLQVNVAAGTLSTEETLFLDTWAERDTETVWRLDRGKILSEVERGRKVAELREFLEARDPQGLPETVDGFLATAGRQAGALKNTGTVLLIECADAALADLIAGHELTKSLCLRAGPKHLAVKADAEERFRQAVHGLGYGMPRV
jgi:hypothetical protein